jgi:spore photoproduct lyase
MLEEGKGGLFPRMKRRLLGIRYPSMKTGDDPHIMPFIANTSDKECPVWDSEIYPKRIFVEKSVKDLDWTARFIANFTEAETVLIGSMREVLQSLAGKDPIGLYNARRDNLFVVKNKAAFVKACPCTKKVIRCGYTILNMGFGCALDCSYCYLQLYSNFPGLVLPANIEDYRAHVIDFDSKMSKKTRIGTGEFTDSLYLDRYTKYSSFLMPLFRGMKNLVLELKTKTIDIDNVLEQEPHDNVVISWSMNTRDMARRYEKGGASVEERIDAARRAARRGFRVGFHFDPIVYYEGWEREYEALVKEIFSVKEIARNAAWVSLGTLRYTPGLKQIAERRFADNNIYYYGDFFAGTDGKLRYHPELRIAIYDNMIRWIRSSGTPAWIYLCMEPDGVWKKTGLRRKDYSFS